MRWSALAASLVVLTSVPTATGLVTPAVAQAPAQHLPLGDRNLPETRTVTRVAPGVTWTRIRRGRTEDPREHWTVEVALLREQQAARELAGRLTAKGFAPVVTRVDDRPRDLPSRQPWGWRVRVGTLADQDAAGRLVKDLRAAGFDPARTYFTGEDDRAHSGPWVVDVLRVAADQRNRVQARQSLDHVPGGETLAEMVHRTHAIAGINGSYGSDEEDGTFGDVAGLSVLHGEMVSEAVRGRSALVLPSDRRHRPSVQQLSTTMQLRAGDGAERTLDGLNRAPGVIRSCGGPADEVPTARPRHDWLCTDTNDIIQYTGFYNGPIHKGDGTAVVLGRDGKVLEVRDHRDGTVPRGDTVLAGIGNGAQWLRDHAHKGSRLTVTTDIVDQNHKSLPATAGRGADVVSGGPQLLRNGRIVVPADAEGFNYPEDPSFFDYFATHRHPRTLAGITTDGSLLLVTVDGRRPGWSEGASFEESAAVLRSLGAVDAVNLDGGGSTAMVVDGTLVNRPSDSTGPRQVANALIIR